MSSGKIRLRISPGVAAYVSQGIAVEEKIRGVEKAADMSPVDQVTLLFCLMRDKDSIVKSVATAAFSTLTEECLLACIRENPDLHPAILDVISLVHSGMTSVSEVLLACPALSPMAASHLNWTRTESCTPDNDALVARNESLACDDQSGMEAVGTDLDTEGETCQEEEYLSKFQMIQLMGVSEKIKMALTGDKEWRSILINDNNKLVSGSVIKNPRITDGEILQILKVGVQNDEILRLICANKEWVKNYQIRKALVDCPKTPLPLALRFLTSLNEKDIAGYAKSKNISSVIATHAKRIILAKKK